MAVMAENPFGGGPPGSAAVERDAERPGVVLSPPPKASVCAGHVTEPEVCVPGGLANEALTTWYDAGAVAHVAATVTWSTPGLRSFMSAAHPSAVGNDRLMSM